MRIFGFEIRRVKKIEREEEERFKKIVSAIMVTTEQLVTSIKETTLHIGEFDYVSLITNQSMFLEKECRQYIDSKFSSPSACLTLPQYLNSFPKNLDQLTEAMVKARQFDEVIKEKAKEMDITPTELFFSDAMKPMVQEIQGLVNTCTEKMVINVINISTCVSGDYVKLTDGTDFVDDYRKRSQLGNDKDVKSYNISFKLISKDKILSKNEKTK